MRSSSVHLPLDVALLQHGADAIREFGRPEYEGWLAQYPHVPTLEAKAVVEAFRKWDSEVGAQKTK